MRNFYGYNPFDLVASQATCRLSPRGRISLFLAMMRPFGNCMRLINSARNSETLSRNRSANLRSTLAFEAVPALLHLRVKRAFASPDTERICCERDLEKWSFRQFGPAVMKLDGTSGGHGVKVVRSETEAARPFESSPGHCPQLANGSGTL